MLVGLIESGQIALTHWVSYVHGHAQCPQSSAQRFARWLVNERIEENFLDDKSNAFQLEFSLIRSADDLTRLGFILAITAL